MFERDDRRLWRTDDPGCGFVQQHLLHAAGTNGESIDLRVCIVIKVGADDLITRIDEYFDPADMAPLMNR